MNTWKYKRMMGLACVMVAMTWVGCGDPDVEDNGENNQNTENNSTENHQNGENQNNNHNNDHNQENQNQENHNENNEEGCDVMGFVAPDDLVITENARGWSLMADGGEQMLSLFMSHQGDAIGDGSASFDDTPLEDQVDSLLMAEDCTPSGCDTMFVATGGTVEVIDWDMESEGRFEAQFSDLELAEVVLTEAGIMEYVEFGLTWCVESLTLNATSEPMATFPEDIACDRQDFVADDTAFSATAMTDSSLIIEALSSANEPHDVMSLQLYDSTIAEGSHELDDFDYASCEECLLVYAGCEGNSCEKIFIAGAGALEITSVGTSDDAFAAGEQFTATLSDAKLVEVNIHPTTYDTEIVDGGESWCIDEFSWDVTIVDNE